MTFEAQESTAMITLLLTTFIAVLVTCPAQSAEIFGQDVLSDLSQDDWRTVYDELFFAQPGNRNEVERESYVQSLIAKMGNLLNKIDWRRGGVTGVEYEFAKTTFRKITQRDTCNVFARQNMEALRAELLRHPRRLELGAGSEPSQELLIDKYLDKTVESQLRRCTARILDLRDLVRKDVSVADWRRIHRIYWVNTNINSEPERENEFVEDTVRVMLNECSKRSLFKRILSFKERDSIRDCYDSLYSDPCRKLTDLYETQTTHAGEPDIATIMEAQKGGLLGLEEIETVAEFIGLRDACLGISFKDVFERVYGRYIDLKRIASEIN